jgi:hypothetical protein
MKAEDLLPEALYPWCKDEIRVMKKRLFIAIITRSQEVHTSDDLQNNNRCGSN